MRLLRPRNRGEQSPLQDFSRPEPDEAELAPSERLGAEGPQPQPEHGEPQRRDPELTDLSRRDYLAIVRRALREAGSDHITNLAAALAYYAFLAIPSALLVAVGVFSLLAGPHAITTVIDRLGTVMPGQATTLLRSSLTNLTHRQTTGVTIVGVGGLLALWSMSGAMQNVMWALNVAYDRDESRGFVRRRLTSFGMAFFALLGFALLFGVLILGPHLSRWVGKAVGAEHAVTIVWWVAEWPLLLAGLFVAFAGLLFLGPNVEHPRWSFLSLGSTLAVVVWLAASGLFALYASKFGSYNKTWGSLSAVVVMLTWLWLSGVALLFGAEINAEAERSRELREGQPAERELQAPRKT